MTMLDRIDIQAARHPYSVRFSETPFAGLVPATSPPRHVFIDRRVAQLHRAHLGALSDARSVLELDATETAKSLDQLTGYVEHLVAHGFRRDHLLVAVGGGIIQDIVAFIAATLMRGVDWVFYPTTLLAQADSCIGSKSSINVGQVKNLMGCFYPPLDIQISVDLLATLDAVDRRSGIGEILKVHIIDGPESFTWASDHYQDLLSDDEVLREGIVRALSVKKRFIEVDEFDTGLRSIFNYGHTFGHAIEAATDFEVPHGIAVSIGMALANAMSVAFGRMSREDESRMRPTLEQNAQGFGDVPLSMTTFFAALAKDKKNQGQLQTVVLPGLDSLPEKVQVPLDKTFKDVCTGFLDESNLLTLAK